MDLTFTGQIHHHTPERIKPLGIQTGVSSHFNIDDEKEFILDIRLRKEKVKTQ